MSRRLRGDHCHCATCGEYFNSTYAFDKHRTGRYAPMERVCLSPDEMTAKGMAPSSTGWWTSRPKANTSSPVMRASGDLTGAAT